MTITPEELERRVEALEQGVLADIRLAVTAINRNAEDIRLRMTRVEDRLDKVSAMVPELIVNAAAVRERAASIETEIRATKAIVAELRWDLPALVTAALREG
jgi:hypothetical protein